MPKSRRTGTVWLGIDPGASGGIARLGQGEDVATPMPATWKDVWDCVSSVKYRPSTHRVRACIEKVGGYIVPAKDGLTGGPQPGSAAFKFGTSYGALLMALTAAAIPYEEVTPAKWQRGVGVAPRKKGESKTSHKNRLKGRAQALFPSLKVTLATADALLIAHYYRALHEGGGGRDG